MTSQAIIAYYHPQNLSFQDRDISPSSGNGESSTGKKVIYIGNKTLVERGIQACSEVHFSGFRVPFGEIWTVASLNADDPYRAKLHLMGPGGARTRVNVESKFIALFSEVTLELLQKTQLTGSLFYLYKGTKTVKERGFEVGAVVHVGSKYSEKFGTIVSLDDAIPHKAEVCLVHSDGTMGNVWIESSHLLIYDDRVES